MSCFPKSLSSRHASCSTAAATRTNLAVAETVVEKVNFFLQEKEKRNKKVLSIVVEQSRVQHSTGAVKVKVKGEGKW